MLEGELMLNIVERTILVMWCGAFLSSCSSPEPVGCPEGEVQVEGGQGLSEGVSRGLLRG